MIVLTDAAEQALLDELRAIPGTADIVQALTLAKREPDLYRLTWPNAPPSNWRKMPVERIKPSHGNPLLEYAYVV